MTRRVKDYSIYVSACCVRCNNIYSWRQGRQSKLDPDRNKCPTCRRAPRSGRKRISKKTEICVDCSIAVYRGKSRCRPCAVLFRYPTVFNTCKCGQQIQKYSIKCLTCHNKDQDLGKSTERTKFQNSKEWKEVRTNAFIRDDFQCQICYVYGVFLNAHHLKKYHTHPELRLDVDNLLTVCEECHYEIHTKG